MTSEGDARDRPKACAGPTCKDLQTLTHAAQVGCTCALLDCTKRRAMKLSIMELFSSQNPRSRTFRYILHEEGLSKQDGQRLKAVMERVQEE